MVRAPNWLGDAMLSLPALRDLRRNFPQARIAVLARAPVAPLYAAVAEVDGTIASTGVTADAAVLRGRFDAAVILPNSFGSAFTAAHAGIPHRWGYATDGRSLLLTRRARLRPEVRGRSEVYYYRAMLSGIGLRTTALPDASLACPDEWRAAGAARLGNAGPESSADNGPWIGLNPGAFFGTAKRWIPERYAAVADLASERLGARTVILGAAAERPLGEAVRKAMRRPAAVLCGETNLQELTGVLAQLSLLLTNDSGPMHVASALGTPVVAIFGPTDWRETAPFGPGRSEIVRETVACSPCKLRDCPIDHRCMTRVGVGAVLAAAGRVS